MAKIATSIGAAGCCAQEAKASHASVNSARAGARRTPQEAIIVATPAAVSEVGTYSGDRGKASIMRALRPPGKRRRITANGQGAARKSQNNNNGGLTDEAPLSRLCRGRRSSVHRHHRSL